MIPMTAATIAERRAIRRTRPYSHVRRRMEDRHHLLQHLLTVCKPALLITPERMLDDAHEALVAIGARLGGAIVTCGELFHEVVVRNELPDVVEVAHLNTAVIA